MNANLTSYHPTGIILSSTRYICDRLDLILTARQQTIIAIALTAFSCLTLTYLVAKKTFFRARNTPSNQLKQLTENQQRALHEGSPRRFTRDSSPSYHSPSPMAPRTGQNETPFLCLPCDREIFIGELDDDSNGKGTYFDCEGGIFKGTFKNGKLTGKGSSILSDGTVAYGIYVDGELVRGVMTEENRVNIGPFERQDLTGKACRILLTGDYKLERVIEAEFRDGTVA